MAAVAYPLPLSAPWSRQGRNLERAPVGGRNGLRLVESLDRSSVEALAPVRVLSPRIVAPAPTLAPGVVVAARKRSDVDSRSAIQARRRVLRRRRALVSSVATIGIFVGLWTGSAALVGGRNGGYVYLAGSTPYGASYRYVVRPGDTLWSIATRLDPTGDPRPLINRLSTQLRGGELEVGMKLVIP